MAGTDGEAWLEDVLTGFLLEEDVETWLRQLNAVAAGVFFEKLARLREGTLEAEWVREVPREPGLYELVVMVPDAPEAVEWTQYRVTLAVHQDDGVHHLLSWNSEHRKDDRYIGRAKATMARCCLR